MLSSFGTGAMMITVFLLLIAIYILLRFLKGGENREYIEMDEAQEAARISQIKKKEKEFLDSFTGPMLEDGIEDLDMAIESIKLGAEYFDNGAFVEAGEEFVAARKSTDESAKKLKEVIAMVEDPAHTNSVMAKKVLEECKMFREGSERMEKACDAMLDGNEKEAKELAANKEKLLKMAKEWTR
ncbi:hypothetical protein CUJ83_15025 [Methanocella sp. CWC-04]|uniref:Uncharacterized protein n=1 Tax=Methanooceanicella nereidis TaxID=2052831 RepID=A0AAP2REN2_9EURY|nr:hypothetical protein [Methanocella sp. CWC-04]MCD1296314.1 hypothetical protein [Methanocella sp. CWC-04]